MEAGSINIDPVYLNPSYSTKNIWVRFRMGELSPEASHWPALAPVTVFAELVFLSSSSARFESSGPCDDPRIISAPNVVPLGPLGVGIPTALAFFSLPIERACLGRFVLAPKLSLAKLPVWLSPWLSFVEGIDMVCIESRSQEWGAVAVDGKWVGWEK